MGNVVFLGDVKRNFPTGCSSFMVAFEKWWCALCSGTTAIYVEKPYSQILPCTWNTNTCKLFSQVVAVAARKLEDAQSFAQKHNIRRAYGSYEELARDPDIGEMMWEWFVWPTKQTKPWILVWPKVSTLCSWDLTYKLLRLFFTFVQMWCILVLSTLTIWAPVCSSPMPRKMSSVRSHWQWTPRRCGRSWTLQREMTSSWWR